MGWEADAKKFLESPSSYLAAEIWGPDNAYSSAIGGIRAAGHQIVEQYFGQSELEESERAASIAIFGCPTGEVCDPPPGSGAPPPPAGSSAPPPAGTPPPTTGGSGLGISTTNLALLGVGAVALWWWLR